MIYDSSSQNNNDNSLVRPMAVGGSFYPDHKEELHRMMSSFFSPYIDKEKYEKVAAVIVPHAG